MLRAIGDPSADSHMNLMLNTAITWNEDANREYDREADKDSGAHVIYGVIAQVARGKKEFIKRFDEYLYASAMSRTQDPTTGFITLTTKLDNGSEWEIELEPQVAKRYTYAF